MYITEKGTTEETDTVELSGGSFRIACLLAQAWIPSPHVYANFGSPGFPQFWNQAPPDPQQLARPVFLLVPHLGQTRPLAVII